MADGVNLKLVVKHIVDGTLEENLCRVCLKPLGAVCENVFTTVCKEDQEFCVADVLKDMCNAQFSETEGYNVCTECFLMASTAYRLFLLTKRSSEILHFYFHEIEKNVNSIVIPEDNVNDTICITLPEYNPTVSNLDCGILFCLTDEYFVDFEEGLEDVKFNIEPKAEYKSECKTLQKDEDIIVVVEKNGVKSFYKLSEKALRPKKGKQIEVTSKPKIRRKRTAMDYIKCSQCPVKYRFFAKLKLHMKEQHNIDLFLCKVCKEVVEGEIEFDRHSNTHTNIHRCNICNTVFKKRDTIIAHLKWHTEMKNMSNMEGAHVCEICGFILQDEEQLKEHCDQKHEKKYSCQYCGKMYRGELSCQAHVQKHERHMAKESFKNDSIEEIKEKPKRNNNKRKNSPMCATCGKNFVDERALMWHLMLHTDERPYTCDVCGRGFISLNRRNQHVLCAHTMPTKRCPLCPALFHLRSMVNSHIKKVHLKTHKRRNRSSKHRKVHWRTETVPIQELSVDIQNEILEIQTNLPGEPFTAPVDEDDPEFKDDWVGRCKDNLCWWGYCECNTCECGAAQTMPHLLICPMCPTTCTIKDLWEGYARANVKHGVQ